MEGHSKYGRRYTRWRCVTRNVSPPGGCGCMEKTPAGPPRPVNMLQMEATVFLEWKTKGTW